MENADQSKITKLLDKPIKLSYMMKNEAEKNRILYRILQNPIFDYDIKCYIAYKHLYK